MGKGKCSDIWLVHLATLDKERSLPLSSDNRIHPNSDVQHGYSRLATETKLTVFAFRDQEVMDHSFSSFVRQSCCLMAFVFHQRNKAHHVCVWNCDLMYGLFIFFVR